MTELEEPLPVDLSGLPASERTRIAFIVAQENGKVVWRDIQEHGERACAISAQIAILIAKRIRAARSGQVALAEELQDSIGELRAKRDAEHAAQRKLLAHQRALNESVRHG